MGWKPARGSGICFQKAFDREAKYRNLLVDAQYKPLSFMQHSKLYYHWLIAARDFAQINSTNKSRNPRDYYGKCLPKTTLKSFETHRELCYKPLLQYMPNEQI
jgi:hypothetical protein